MSWRTVVITKHCKLSFKNGYMCIRDENLETVHISEIGTLIIDTTMVSVTSALLSELINNKVKIIFCDERHLPQSELVPYYGSHNSSKRIREQIGWKEETKSAVWTEIVKQKIGNQANLLSKMGLCECDELYEYINQIEKGDITNREGFAAKVYFKALFGHNFKRDNNCDVNAGLDYGYSVLLSSFSKEISKNGYLTQLGICHKNEFNYYNFASDLMEPFRIIIDEMAVDLINNYFDKDMKMKFISVLNKQVKLAGKEYYLTNAIEIYVKSVFNALNKNDLSLLTMYEFE